MATLRGWIFVANGWDQGLASPFFAPQSDALPDSSAEVAHILNRCSVPEHLQHYFFVKFPQTTLPNTNKQPASLEDFGKRWRTVPFSAGGCYVPCGCCDYSQHLAEQLDEQLAVAGDAGLAYTGGKHHQASPCMPNSTVELFNANSSLLQ